MFLRLSLYHLDGGKGPRVLLRVVWEVEMSRDWFRYVFVDNFNIS